MTKLALHSAGPRVPPRAQSYIQGGLTCTLYMYM